MAAPRPLNIFVRACVCAHSFASIVAAVGGGGSAHRGRSRARLPRQCRCYIAGKHAGKTQIIFFLLLQGVQDARWTWWFFVFCKCKKKQPQKTKQKNAFKLNQQPASSLLLAGLIHVLGYDVSLNSVFIPTFTECWVSEWSNVISGLLVTPIMQPTCCWFYICEVSRVHTSSLHVIHKWC